MRQVGTMAPTIANGSGWSDERGMAIVVLVAVLAIAWARHGGRLADYHHPARGLALALASTLVLVVVSVLAWQSGWVFGVWAIVFAFVPAVGALRTAANMRLRRRLEATHDQDASNRPRAVPSAIVSPTPTPPLPPLRIEETTLESLAPAFRPPVDNAPRTIASVLAMIFAVPRAGAVRTLFLWVFAERPSDQLLHAAQQVGPVYLLRGGGILADRPLAVLFGDADEHIEESEQEVLARLGSFDRVRTRMHFARHSMLCGDPVWTFALGQLIERTTCVVMDLRKYEFGRVGCEYEVGVLIDRVPLDNVAFVVESTVNGADVRGLIERSWAKMATDSPNRHPGNSVRLVIAQHIDDGIPDDPAAAYLPAERERIGFEQLLVDLAATRPAASFPPPDPRDHRRRSPVNRAP